MFDHEHQIRLEGTVTEFRWQNPHIYMEAPDSKGKMRHWTIECANPGILNRLGWKFNMIKKGDKIMAIVGPLRTGEAGALLKQAMIPMEVLQTGRQTTIIQEAYNQVRRIYHDYTLPPVEDAEPGFWGHSTGKWDGNDFVVETIGIKDYVRFRGVPHSANMRILERMRRIDADHFENDVTVEDPEYLTGPWKWVYQRRPDYKMYEYVCEDNREYADPETGQQRLRIDTE